MATIGRLKPGQIVWSVNGHDRYSGLPNSYRVQIIEVHADDGWVLASYNGNPPRQFWKKSVIRWRVNDPMKNHGGHTTRL